MQLKYLVTFSNKFPVAIRYEWIKKIVMLGTRESNKEGMYDILERYFPKQDKNIEDKITQYKGGRIRIERFIEKQKFVDAIYLMFEECDCVRKVKSFGRLIY